MMYSYCTLWMMCVYFKYSPSQLFILKFNRKSMNLVCIIMIDLSIDQMLSINLLSKMTKLDTHLQLTYQSASLAILKTSLDRKS
jgi:hypothetical protein